MILLTALAEDMSPWGAQRIRESVLNFLFKLAFRIDL